MNELSLLEGPRGRGPFDIEDAPADVAPSRGRCPALLALPTHFPSPTRPFFDNLKKELC